MRSLVWFAALPACIVVAPDEVNVDLPKGQEPAYVFTPDTVTVGVTELVNLEFPKEDRDAIEEVVGIRFDDAAIAVDDWQPTDDGLDLVITAEAPGQSAATLEYADGSELVLANGLTAVE